PDFQLLLTQVGCNEHAVHVFREAPHQRERIHVEEAPTKQRCLKSWPPDECFWLLLSDDFRFRHTNLLVCGRCPASPRPLRVARLERARPRNVRWIAADVVGLPLYGPVCLTHW